jgi:hypothetical protein
MNDRNNHHACFCSPDAFCVLGFLISPVCTALKFCVLASLVLATCGYSLGLLDVIPQ